MTDERQGAQLWPALDELPPGAGVIIRHYGLAPVDRRNLIRRIWAIAQRRQLICLTAGDSCGIRTDGIHDRSARPTPAGQIRSVAVHDQAELLRAETVGADLIFISPVFATCSHPEANPLGQSGFERLAQATAIPAIALGGMTAARGYRMQKTGAYGWAAIGALTPPN
jgi:thiamine-phosphate pyrophosphorylase